MAPQKTKVSMAGVAEGKELIGVPTGEGVSAEERVKAQFNGSVSEEMYQVSTALLDYALFHSTSTGRIGFLKMQFFSGSQIQGGESLFSK